jgi:hypothetical protein
VGHDVLWYMVAILGLKNWTKHPRLRCSEQHFHPLGIKSILVLSPLDLAKGEIFWMFFSHFFLRYQFYSMRYTNLGTKSLSDVTRDNMSNRDSRELVFDTEMNATSPIGCLIMTGIRSEAPAPCVTHRNRDVETSHL